MCTVFWRGVCVLRDSKDMTTFSILNYFYAIIFAFLLHPTVGGGERGTPTQATNTANKGRAGTAGHTLTHRRGGGGVRGRVRVPLSSRSGQRGGGAVATRGGVVRRHLATGPGAGAWTGDGGGAWTATAKRQKVRTRGRNRDPPYRKKVDFTERGQRVRRHRTQTPHVSEPYIWLDCQAS